MENIELSIIILYSQSYYYENIKNFKDITNYSLKIILKINKLKNKFIININLNETIKT